MRAWTASLTEETVTTVPCPSCGSPMLSRPAREAMAPSGNLYCPCPLPTRWENHVAVLSAEARP